MNLLLTDCPVNLPFVDNKTNRYLDLSQLNIKNCIGCFGCWTKTPGKCVIRDDATKVYPLIAKSENIIYVSRVKFGTYDAIMKTMLERAIPIQKAFIQLHHGETHHMQGDVVEKNAVIIAYGCDNREEQDLFQRLVARNAYNMRFQTHKVLFVFKEELEQAIIREVEKWENF